MKTRSNLLLVPFREVRHDQPDDCLHYEPVRVRAEEYQWVIPAHRHEGLHQLQLLVRGSAQATIDGVAQRLDAPAIVLVAPGSVHGFHYAPETEGHQLTLPSQTLRQLLGASGQLAGELDRSFMRAQLGEAAHGCGQHFTALADEFLAARPGRVPALMAWASLIALWFLRHAGAPSAEATRQAMRDTLVQRFRALLELHYRRHQPLAFYAQSLGVTADHLSRTCRAITGQGALELVHGRLMLEARRLLSYTALPVAEVAHQLGYEDPAYFSKFFSRVVGESPSQWRESAHAGLRTLP